MNSDREEEGKGETRGRGWWWRFGKRTVEKPLDSYESENSTESRQTDRRWLRLTGSATSLPFLSHWSSCSIPLFPPSNYLSIVLFSFRHWCAILWLPLSQSPVLQQQPCYSLHMTCRHDPKHTPKSQTGAPHNHTAAEAMGSCMTEGVRYTGSVNRWACVRGELPVPEMLCGRNNNERGMDRGRKD